MTELQLRALVSLREVLVFAAVGALATLAHYLVAVLAVEKTFLGIYWANIVAYCVAVVVSFIGHSVFTFRKSVNADRAFRFLVVSLSALGLSQLLLFGLQYFNGLSHRLEFLIIVLFVPFFSYLLNKYWVYKH